METVAPATGTPVAAAVTRPSIVATRERRKSMPVVAAPSATLTGVPAVAGGQDVGPQSIRQ